MAKYLNVVDYQNDFITGALANEQAQLIMDNIRKLLHFASANGYKILFTKDTHDENYLDCKVSTEGKYLPIVHCIKNTPGWEVADPIKATSEYHNLREGDIIEKPTFGFTEWEKVFAENTPDEIIWCGVCTDICVVSNAIICKALYPKAQHIVVSNACAGVTERTHEAALLTMKQCHIDIVELSDIIGNTVA